MIEKLKIILPQVNHKSVIIVFGIPKTDAEIQDMYKFRYDEYQKRGHLVDDKVGLDIDEYDRKNKCVYYVATLDDEIIGSVRLIQDVTLPMKKNFFKFEENKYTSNIAEEKKFEIGRLISKRVTRIVIPRHIVMLGFFKIINDYCFENGLLMGVGTIKKSIKTKLDLMRFPIHQYKRFKQKYKPTESEDSLSHFFKDTKDPLIPVYYRRDQGNEYLDSFFNKSTIFERQKFNVYILKKHYPSFIDVLTLLMKQFNYNVFANSNIVISQTAKQIYREKIIDYSPLERSIIDLSLTENPLGCSKRIYALLNDPKWIKEIALYPSGFRKNKLISYISETNKLLPDNVIIDRGASGVLDLVISTYLNQGEQVMIPSLSFPYIYFSIIRSGGKIKFTEMVGFHIDFESILNNITSKTKMIIICNPNNPTGLFETKEKILNIVENVSCLVVIDEANGEFVKESLVPYVNKYHNLIVVKSFSKIYGLASMRIGYGLASEMIIQNLHIVQTPHSTSTISHMCALEAIQDSRHVDQGVQFIKDERIYLYEELVKLGFDVIESYSNCMLIKVPKKIGSSSIFVDLLKKHNVNVINGKFFPTLGDNYIRISPQHHDINKKFIEILNTLT